MDLSTNSGIQSSYIIEVEPLNESHELVKESVLEVDIWNWCITNQFPIGTIEKIDSENVILNIGSPHQGYTIETKMRDGKLNGKATLKTMKNTIIGEFEYRSNELKGECKLYYDSGELYFEGNLEDGYRQGLGKEYDKNGNVIFEGYFEKGCRGNHCERMDGMEGYWKELDGNGNVISICKRNENGMNEGLCYYFESGSLDRVSIWENNEEISIVYRFQNGKMIEYKDGVKCFEGYYEGSIEKGFSRKYGEEYDNEGKNVIYEGEFLNGKRYGLGTSYIEKSNEIEYDGEWVKGFPKFKFILLFAVIPVLSGLCIVILTFSLPLPTILKWLIIIAVLIIGLFLYNYIRKSLKPVSFVTKDFEPTILSKQYIYEYDNDCVIFEDESYSEVQTFKMDGLNRLKRIKVGKNSFTKKKNSWGNDSSKSFHILNCESLESIEIGEFSFSDFGGEFELKNLPQLQSIQIGTIGNISNNFYYSSFVIRGIYMILNIVMIRSSKSAIHYIR